MGKILSGHFWYTNFWVPDPPFPPRPPNTSLPPAPPLPARHAQAAPPGTWSCSGCIERGLVWEQRARNSEVRAKINQKKFEKAKMKDDPTWREDLEPDTALINSTSSDEVSPPPPPAGQLL